MRMSRLVARRPIHRHCGHQFVPDRLGARLARTGTGPPGTILGTGIRVGRRGRLGSCSADVSDAARGAQTFPLSHRNACRDPGAVVPEGRFEESGAVFGMRPDPSIANLGETHLGADCAPIIHSGPNGSPSIENEYRATLPGRRNAFRHIPANQGSAVTDASAAGRQCKAA